MASVEQSLPVKCCLKIIVCIVDLHYASVCFNSILLITVSRSGANSTRAGSYNGPKRSGLNSKRFLFICRIGQFYRPAGSFMCVQVHDEYAGFNSAHAIAQTSSQITLSTVDRWSKWMQDATRENGWFSARFEWVPRRMIDDYCLDYSWVEFGPGPGIGPQSGHIERRWLWRRQNG